MTITLHAIDTRYAGCLFRSRREARWAVFLDALHVKWRYEPQGFELPTGEPYLPDFWLPGIQIWLEIKGHEDPNGIQRWREFSRAVDPAWLEDNPDEPNVAHDGPPNGLRGRSFLALGDIPDPRRLANRQLTQEDALEGSAGRRYYWIRCPKCKAKGITWDGRAERLSCRCVDGITPQGHHDTILRAYAAARAARFEHDQQERWVAD